MELSFFDPTIPLGVVLLAALWLGLSLNQRSRTCERDYGWGWQCMSQKQYIKALKQFDRALASKPDFFEALVARALVLQLLDRLKEAEAAYTQAIVLRPAAAELYASRGWVRARLQTWAEAFADFDRALTIAPTWALGYNNRGYAHLLRGDLEPARHDFDEALQSDPNLAIAYNNRGHTRYLQGEYRAALEDIELALKLKPDNPEAYFNRGRVLLALDAPKELAVHDLKQALALLDEKTGDGMFYWPSLKDEAIRLLKES